MTAILEQPLVLCEAYSVAYNARLERLNTGVYSERDKRDEVFNRGKRAERAKVERDRKRVSRAWDRTNRERDAAKANRLKFWKRREVILHARLAAIRDRVIVEHKIKPPGKSLKSDQAYREKIWAALREDAEFLAYESKRDRFDRLMDRIKARYPGIAADILAIDDRATRHAKVRAYRERMAQS